MNRRTFTARTGILAALLAAAAAPAARACPPSLTVERPSARLPAGDAGAYVVVRASHGCHAGPFAVSGSAEGLIDGARRSIALDLGRADTAGVYRVRRQWPREGVWVLRFTVTEGDGHATALVGIGPSGEVATVREPARSGQVRDVSDADVAALLRSLAASS
ncbi:MAG TPA: hypothetical protein VEH83_02225 [Gemmatimonadales bacterium]|nr:hypothetical protein [Gemmatimonadales bacterium]